MDKKEDRYSWAYEPSICRVQPQVMVLYSKDLLKLKITEKEDNADKSSASRLGRK